MKWKTIDIDRKDNGIAYQTDKMKVPFGWLVRTTTDMGTNLSDTKFVFDPFHSWK